MSKDITKNTSEYVNENGKFKKGNKGKPKGATNRTTRDIREFITNFLNDKAYEIPHIWNSLEDKDKATLFLHLCRLVLPKPPEETPPETKEIVRPPIAWTDDEPRLTPSQIDRLIDKL